MNNPTLQELMDYVDGTLDVLRRHDVERLITSSKQLQHEVAMLQAMRNSVHSEQISPSKKFTANIMSEILPQRHESFWFRMIKNSSNVFAMVIVLSLIGAALIASSQSSSPTVGQIGTTIDAFSSTYNSAVDRFSGVINEYTKPVNGVLKTTSGKLLLLGFIIFSFFVIIDEFVGKRVTFRK